MNRQQEIPLGFLSLSPEIQREIEITYENGQHVYFALAKDLNLVKIGASNNPIKRLTYLVTACPVPLELIYVFPYGGYMIENKLHSLFQALHTQGEWFRYEQPIKDIIKEMKQLCEEVDLRWNPQTQKVQ